MKLGLTAGALKKGATAGFKKKGANAGVLSKKGGKAGFIAELLGIDAVVEVAGSIEGLREFDGAVDVVGTGNTVGNNGGLSPLPSPLGSMVGPLPLLLPSPVGVTEVLGPPEGCMVGNADGVVVGAMVCSQLEALPNLSHPIEQGLAS